MDPNQPIPGGFPPQAYPPEHGQALPPNEHVQVYHEHLAPPDQAQEQDGYYQNTYSTGYHPNQGHQEQQYHQAWQQHDRQHYHPPPSQPGSPPPTGGRYPAADQYVHAQSPIQQHPPVEAYPYADNWHDAGGTYSGHGVDQGKHERAHHGLLQHLTDNGLVSADTGARAPSPHGYTDDHVHPAHSQGERPPFDPYHARYDPAQHHPPQADRTPRHRHREPRRKKSSDQQQIQIIMPDTAKHSQDSSMKSISDQMQLMMMNQMMAQQMTAQQMQYAQMNAMMGEKLGGGGKEKKSKRKKPAVNIKTKQVGRRAPRQAAPIVAVPPKVVAPVSSIESAAMENWQEATIILCIAIVGVIYLIVSRSSKEQEKEASLAAKHLVPK